MKDSNQLKLSWMNCILLIIHGMHVSGLIWQNTKGIDDAVALREDFENILETPPAFIMFNSNDAQYNRANGKYRLIPYYERIDPSLKPQDITQSKFIINKHVISGQWQITEFESNGYPLSKNVLTTMLEHQDQTIISNYGFCEKLQQKNEFLKTSLNDLQNYNMKLQENIQELKLKLQKKEKSKIAEEKHNAQIQKHLQNVKDQNNHMRLSFIQFEHQIKTLKFQVKDLQEEKNILLAKQKFGENITPMNEIMTKNIELEDIITQQNQRIKLLTSWNNIKKPEIRSQFLSFVEAIEIKENEINMSNIQNDADKLTIEQRKELLRQQQQNFYDKIYAKELEFRALDKSLHEKVNTENEKFVHGKKENLIFEHKESTECKNDSTIAFEMFINEKFETVLSKNDWNYDATNHL